MLRRWIHSVVVLVAALGMSCQELPRYFTADELVARAGKSELRLRDVQGVVPRGVTGEDSAAFMKVYVERWVRKQLKLQEAEVLFSASAEDLEKMVEEYRQALLIRKLDQYYIDQSIDTTFTAEEIRAYYEAHRGDFRLDRTLVKGRIVSLPVQYRQAQRLKTLMGSPTEARQQDFRDLCEKNNFQVSDYRSQWIDFAEFLNALPTRRSQNNNALLASTAVQEMHDGRSRYYFQIEAVCREGDVTPIERLEGTIRRILFNQRQQELVRQHEQELYERAVEQEQLKLPESFASESEEPQKSKK